MHISLAELYACSSSNSLSLPFRIHSTWSILVPPCIQLTHSLNEPKVVALFLNDNLLPALAKVISKTPTVKFVIYDGDGADSKAIETIKNTRSDEGGIKVLTLDEVREMGKKQKFDPVPPKEDGEYSLYLQDSPLSISRWAHSDDPWCSLLSIRFTDTCCIMYTSGSTGAPKGVILSHKNICASVAAVHFLLIHVLQPSDTYVGECCSCQRRSVQKSSS